MGIISFAIISVTHTGGVKGAVISKIIAGNGNFFANGQKYHAMTHVNVSSYIYDTWHFVNVLMLTLCLLFHGYFMFTYQLTGNSNTGNMERHGDLLNSLDETHLALIVCAVFIFIMILISTLILLLFRYRKKKRQMISKFFWENNELFDSEDDNGIMDNEDVNDFGDDIVLPNWLINNKEIIVPNSCIEKGLQIGNGQFGAVFKGTFSYGNAMYVKITY